MHLSVTTKFACTLTGARIVLALPTFCRAASFTQLSHHTHILHFLTWGSLRDRPPPLENPKMITKQNKTNKINAQSPSFVTEALVLPVRSVTRTRRDSRQSGGNLSLFERQVTPSLGVRKLLYYYIFIFIQGHPYRSIGLLTGCPKMSARCPTDPTFYNAPRNPKTIFFRHFVGTFTLEGWGHGHIQIS